MDDLRISILCNNMKMEQTPCNTQGKQIEENVQMTENFSVTECSLDVLAPDTTEVKVQGLTIQVRKYFCFKLSDSMLRNFRNSEKMTNLNLAKENIQYIARNKEFNIFQESKTIVEYKVSMIKQTLEFENCTIDEDISRILKLRNDDFLKEIDQWRPYFNVFNRCNVAQTQLNKFNHMKKTSSKNPVINKFRNHSADNKSSQVLKDIGNEAPKHTVSTKGVKCSKENNEVRRSQCLKIRDDVLLSTSSIAKKYPILHSTQEKKNINSTILTDVINTKTDQIQNSQHIINKSGYSHHSQEEKSDSIVNEKDDTSFELLFQKLENNLTCCPCKKRPRLENDLQLEPSDPHILTKQNLNMLKLILKNYYKTPYAPNKDSYKIICREIYTDILDKKIYEPEHLKLYAEDAIKSKKYLQE